MGPGDQIEFEHYIEEPPPERLITNDSFMQELIDKVPTISVSQMLTSPDPLIRNANGWLDRGHSTHVETPDLPYVNVNVYLASKGRALRLMDSLVKGIRKLGYDVEGRDASDRSQYFGILGQRIYFRLKEHSKQVAHVLTTEQMADNRRGGYSSYTSTIIFPLGDLLSTWNHAPGYPPDTERNGLIPQGCLWKISFEIL